MAANFSKCAETIDEVYCIIDDVRPILEDKVDDEYCLDMMSVLINHLQNIRTDLEELVESTNE